MAAVYVYYSTKLRTMNSISGLWLPWGLPYLNATLGAGHTHGSKDIVNDSRPSPRSSKPKFSHVFSRMVQSRSSTLTVAT